MNHDLFKRLVNANIYGAIRSWRTGKHCKGKVKPTNYFANKAKKAKATKIARRVNRHKK
jgi:hypothetical protein